MKIKQIETFKFFELSDKVKQKVLEKFYDINVSFDWWESTYYDAERSGLKIIGFDLDRRRGATGEFILNPIDAAKSFVQEHGETCSTRVTAEAFLKDVADLNHLYTLKYATEPDYDWEEDRDYEVALDDLKTDFLRSILEDYSILLQEEYEYQTSEAQIIEAIEANDYDFTSDGKLA